MNGDDDSGDAILERLTRAIARFGGDAELSYHGGRAGTTRFAGSRVTQTSDVLDQTVQARVAIGRRVGAARVNAVDDAALAAALARARESATALPEGEVAGFAGGAESLAAHAVAFDAATAKVTADERAAAVGHAFDACAKAGMTAAGSCASGTTTLAVATSAGARRVHRCTRARFDLIASDERSSGRRSRDGRSFADVTRDLAAVVEETDDGAIGRALRSRAPSPVAPGAYDVILEPHAVAELLEWLALTSLGARSLEDGSSALAGRMGEAITGALTLYDDALSGEDGCPSAPFDGEGTPRRRVTFLDGGVARAVVHDRATAAHAGAASTGHAASIADDFADGGPAPQHLMLAGGDATVDELVARVERGLYVARFHYVNGLLDTRRALMTGMTRDGVWHIERGRITGAAANQRWTESLLEAGRRVGGISRARTLIAGGLGDAWFVCPTLLVRGWNFSG